MKMMILIFYCSRKIEDNDEDNNLLGFDGKFVFWFRVIKNRGKIN